MTTENGSLDQGSATTEAPDTLHADLAAAFEDKSASSSVTDTTAAPDKDKANTDVSEAARTLAAARKAASATEGTDPNAKPAATLDDPAAKRAAELAAMSPEDRAKAEADDKAKADASAGATEAPQHWPARDREFFAKQAPEVRTWMLGRHKAMEADYTRRVQEVAHIRRESDELKEIFRPFADAMAADGMTIPMATRQLAAAHAKLVADPSSGIQWLASKYGIDLKQVVEGGTQQGQPDPYIRKLEEKVAQLEAGFNGQRSAQQQEAHTANLSKVEQFAEEKDDQGNLLRPYFDDVAPGVALRLRAAREAGQQITLQAAYDAELWANPETRNKVLAAKDAERQAREEDERKRKANAASAASFDVKGEGAATAVVAKTDSVRGDLEAAFSVHGGRV